MQQDASSDDRQPLCLNRAIDAQHTTPYFHLDRVLPTIFEVVGLLVLTIVLVFVGNTQQLLNYYGLGGSNQAIQHSAGRAITAGLSKLDAFSFTDRVVIFIVWAFIGVVCFSLVQAGGTIYKEFQAEERVSSNRYVHPNNFVRAVFWRRVLLSAFGTILGLSLLTAGLYCLLAYILPITLAYTRSFLIGGKLSQFGTFTVGFLLLFGWILLLTIILKAIVNRHRLMAR